MESRRKKRIVVSLTTVFSMVVSLFTGLGTADVMAAQVSIYEAEMALRKGASYVEQIQCSGGAKAGDIGNIEGKVGTVTFSIFAEKSGSYEAVVYAATDGERTFKIQTNGEETQTLVCNGNSFDEPAAYTIDLYLKKGENRIKFENPSEPAPDLDKIEVVGNMTGGYLTVEAELFELDGARATEGIGLSNDHYVGYIGGQDAGNATYKVNIAEAGERVIRVYYAENEERKVDINVNGTSHELACANTGGWTKLCAAPGTVRVDFQEGENTIQLLGVGGGDAPNIDYIQIEMTDEEAQKAVKKMIDTLPAETDSTEEEMRAGAVWVSYQTLLDKGDIDSAGLNRLMEQIVNSTMLNIEAEAATIEADGELEMVHTDNCSNNYYVGGMGSANNGKLIFKVNAGEASKRVLNIYYITEQERKVNVSVNGNNAQTVDCNNMEQTDWTTPESRPATLQVDLRLGLNEIVLSAVEGADQYTPNIDRIEIELTHDEAAETVETMISNLPAALNDSNQMIFTAVKMSYDGLENKTSVTNADKLQYAFDNPQQPEESGNGNQSSNNQNNNSSNNQGGTGEGTDGDSNTEDEEDLPENFAVIFDSAGGTTVFEQTVVEGELVKEPVAPKKDGYVFVGWYIGEEKYDFTEPISKDLRLTAKWETSELKVAQDMFLQLQAEKQLMNSALYSVLSWSRVEETYADAKEEFDRGSAADGVRLQGHVDEFKKAMDELVRIVEETYTVTFDAAGGTEVAEQKVVGGKAVARPNDPIREGYTFLGWYLNDVAYDFTSRVERNILLTAKWEITDLKIVQEQFLKLKEQKNGLNKMFYTDTSWNAMEEAYNAAKAEYDHGEAASATELQNLVDALEQAIKALEIKIIEETYVVTFESVESAESFEQVVKKGKSATEPKDPSKEGYRFLGWYLKGELYDFSKPVEGNLELTGKWEKLETDVSNPTQGENMLPGEIQGNTDVNIGGAVTNQTTTPNGINTQNPGNTAGTNTTVSNVNASVTTVKVTDITISGDGHQIAAGKGVQLTADIWPVRAEGTPVVWITSNPEYATVDEAGKVTTKAAGKNHVVTITAQADDGSGIKAEYEIEVMAKAVKKIKLSADSKEVKAGKKIKVKASINPKASKKMMNSELEWISSNPDYATVNAKGVVKTKKAGKGKKVKITAVATDGSNKKATIKLKLK